MTRPSRHVWIVDAQPPTVLQLSGELGLSHVRAQATAHRRLRGPYTAAGEVVRQITPAVVRDRPDLANRHDIELLTVAPELTTLVDDRRKTLTAAANPRNRTRYHPSGRTTRLAHGLVEYLAETSSFSGPFSLVITDVDDADMTDIEWLAILLRRMNPEDCRVVVHSRDTDLPEPLGAALRLYADRHTPKRTTDARQSVTTGPSLIAEYIAGDCLSHDPRLIQAYEQSQPSARAVLHDARAHQLEALNQASLRLGAIPYHRERGTDPLGAGAQALLHAIERCVLEGFYHAVIELGPRCLGVLDWATQGESCWLVIAKVTTALAALNRPADAEAMYDLACAATPSPSVHLQSAYGRAMLYTRYYTDSRRDHNKAKASVNTAISISSLLPDDQRRAFNITFNENGLALVEMHLGDLDEALRLVEHALIRLDREIDPDEHIQHRSVLAYNRAQLLAAMGNLEQALSAYHEVIDSDPHHSEYYFERASILRRLGRYHEAKDDYQRAIEQSPPYPEPHYNLGDLAVQLGDPDTALAEFSYVLDLDPTFVDARVNRAALRLDIGDLTGAEEDIAAGLSMLQDHPHLHCLRGLVALERGDPDAARPALDRAVDLDPTLHQALVNRAVLRFDNDDATGAIDDLTNALDIVDDPTIRENRAVAYEQLGRFAEAIADCRKALDHPDADRMSLGELLERCLAAEREAATPAPSR